MTADRRLRHLLVSLCGNIVDVFDAAESSVHSVLGIS